LNAAIVLAGGVGKRVGADIPKQFIPVLGKPVLYYTLQIFQCHPEVDAVEVVCLESYRDALDKILEDGHFDKVRWITSGGATFQDSVINGINALKGALSDDDVILVHYGASPLTAPDVISDAIRVCKDKGNASPAASLVYLATDSIDGTEGRKWLDRDKIMCLNTPQAFKFGYACWLYEEAQKRGLLDAVDPHTAPLMFAMGEPVYFSKDNHLNIKITTKEDLLIFKGYLLALKGDEQAE
jgi:2-C-methyl-D-erythritol 4-phosphate cytidylyltransferase